MTSSTADPVPSNNTGSDTNSVPQVADLAVAKTDGVRSVVAGDGAARTFTITVTNAGPNAATGVTLTDTWPAGYTRGAITPPSGATCANDPGGPGFTCALGTVAPGSSRVVTAAYSVPASTPPGPLTNRASVTGPVADPNTANDSATDTNTVATSADLSITKSDSPDPVIAGNAVTYTIVVSNAGPSDAQGVSLLDDLPASLGDAMSCVGAACDPASGGPWSSPLALGTVAAGASTTVRIRAEVDPAVPSGATLSNRASVRSDTPDPDPDDDRATATSAVEARADLSVTKTDGVVSVSAGDDLVRTFTITVSNEGPSTATPVILEDPWPAGYLRGRVSQPSGTRCTDDPAGPGFACDLGSLPPGARRDLTVAYTVPAATPARVVTNTASVHAGTAQDPDGTNDRASDTNAVATSADLSITKTVRPAESVSGGSVTYTLTVSNAGISDARDVLVSDTFPASLVDIAVEAPVPTQYNCSVTGKTLSCSASTHPAGISATFRVSATVVGGAYADGTIVSNTARVSSQTLDPDPADDEATATVSIRSATLVVHKAAVGGDGTFAFMSQALPSASFDLTTRGGSADRTFADLPPGTYDLVEIVPDGWDQTSALCDNGDTPGAVIIDAGDVVTCTFTNTARGTIQVVKRLVPASDVGRFDLRLDDRTLAAGVGDDGTTGPVGLPPGSYTVSETAAAGTTLSDYASSIDCTDAGDSRVASGVGPGPLKVELEPGARVVCLVTNERLPRIALTKTSTPASLPEPGGEVSLSIAVSNSGSVPVSLIGLTDSAHGDLAGRGTCALPQALAPGASYACAFGTRVSGAARTVDTGVATATAETLSGLQASAADDAVVTITDVLPAIAVSKTASRTRLTAPGGDVTFTVSVGNLIPEALVIVALRDDVYGDLDAADNPSLRDNTCANAVGDRIDANGSYTCRFTARVAGTVGHRHVNTVTVTASDDEELRSGPIGPVDLSAVTVVSATDQAVVRIVRDPGAGSAGGSDGSDGSGRGGGGQADGAGRDDAGGDRQPSTDTLSPSTSASSAGVPGGVLGWAAWILLVAWLIVAAGWFVRRSRTREA